MDRLGNNGADEAADLVVGGCRGGLLMLGGICLVFAPGGVLLSLPCIVTLLPFLVLWLIMMVVLVLGGVGGDFLELLFGCGRPCDPATVPAVL